MTMKQSSIMADVVGLVSSIIQIVDFSIKVTTTINDFCSTKQDVPKVFRNIEAQLPLLKSSLQTLGDEHYIDSLSTLFMETLKGLPLVCKAQIAELECCFVR
jgi:hypothetical protein